MRDILKMVQFDYIAGERMMPVVLIAFGIGAAAAILITPLVAAMLIPFAVCVFLPVQSMAARCGFNKFYGIIPIRRSTVTQAAFLEYTVSAFLGELIALLIHSVAKAAKIYISIRQAFTDEIETGIGTLHEESAAIVVILFAVICVFICYMRMMSDLFGQENEAKILILTVFVLMVIAAPVIVMMKNRTLPPVSAWLPQHTAGKAIAVCAAHLVTFGVCALFCRITVKKLADREL